MPYNIQLPDGRLIEGIPDDVSQLDAKKRIMEAFPDIAAKEKRGWGEAATDIGASLVSGVGQLAQLPGQIGKLTGITKAEETPTGLEGIGKQIETFGQESKSAVLKGKEAVRAQKVAQADGMLSEFGTAIKETLKDPALLTSFFAEQAPNLLGSWGGGLVARGTAKALLRNATEEAVGKYGLRGAIGTGAIQQGADVGSDTYETIYKRLTKEGMDDEQANGIALAKARVAALEATFLSLGTAKLPGGATIEQALAGQGIKGGAKGFVKGLVEEAFSESLEEGGGKFASNVGVQEVFPETSLTKGVGEAAGMGALGGGLFGGVAGSVNAGRDERQQEVEAQAQRQKQDALDAIEQVKQAEDQARRDAFEAEQTAIRLRALQEEAPERFRQSQAYEELKAKVDKARESMRKADEAKTAYKESAFHEAQPDLLGDILPSERIEQPTQEEQAPIQQPGQMELPLGNEQGQLNLPGMPAAEAPAQVEAPAIESRPITAQDIKAMGIGGGPNVKIKQAILGKDLADPQQAAEVKAALENYASGDRSAKIIAGVESFLKQPAFYEQERLKLRRPYGSLKKAQAEPIENEQAAIENEVVGEPVAPIIGPSEPSVRVPSKRPRAAAGIEQPQRRGMVPTGDVTGQPISREAGVQRPLEAPTPEAIAAANPFAQITQQLAPEAKPTLVDTPSKGMREETVDELLNRIEAPTETSAETEELLRQLGIPPKVRQEVSSIPAGAFSDNLTTAVQRGDLAGALRDISASSQFNVLEKLVARRLLANKGSLPKIEIVAPGVIQDGVGQYNPYTDTIQIQEGYANSHTVMHEAVHGFLHTLIQKFETEGVKNKGISDLNNLYKFVKEKHPEMADRYGMESLTEFASELMSNRDFQQDLAQIPYRTEAQSLFTAFIRAVLNALGISPTQKLSALAAGMFAADRSMAQGRAVQEMRTGKETGPVAKVTQSNTLEANYAATGAGTRETPSEKTGAFQTIKDTAKSKEAAKGAINRFLNTAETMLFSADAALNNAIRAELESNKTNWDTIKQMMLDVSTSQATHADAVAMQFLQRGAIEYDEKLHKWVAKDDKNSWSGMVHALSDLAKKYNLSFDQMEKYAQEAFVSERLKGLAKNKQEVYSHKTPAQIEAGVKFFDMIPELRDIQKQWNAVRKNAMDTAIKGGLYNEKQAKELLDIMDYVPFYRIEQLAQHAGPKEYGRGLIDFAKNYKIKGSEQEVANIFDNMERWTSYTVSRAVKNRTALSLYNTAKTLFPDEVKDLRIDERTHREQNTIDLWVDGFKRKVEFKDPLFVHAFQGIESAAIPHFGLASSTANFLRKNIVLMPLFSISQLSQDSFGAMLTSGLKNPWGLPLEVAKEFYKTLRGTSTAAKELGAIGATGVRDYSATFVRDSAEILAGLKSETQTGKVMGALEKFAMASDNAVRQAIYNMTMKETGGDKATAMERAFEIINFKRAGASGKVQMLRQVIPFFGAYLQAQNVIYKTLAGKGISPQQRREAQRVLVSNALKIGALAFMYAALASDDDEYQKMDPAIRDRHLLIPGTSFMLPLRSDLTLMPKVIAEYAYLGMSDNAFTDGKKIRRALGDSLTNAVLSPTVAPQIIKPALEVVTNHDFFTGRSIVGQGIANKIVEERYTNSTSELGKLIGSSGLIAPVNVDHLIKGYMGTTGGLGLMLTNAIVNAGSDQVKPEKSWQDAVASTPGLSAFVAKEYGNADKNDFYELRKEVDQVNNTFNAMKKQGRIQEAKELLEENKDLLKVKPQINAINNQLTKLRDYEKQVYENTKMTAEQKGAEIERIRQMEQKYLANVHRLRVMAGY